MLRITVRTVLTISIAALSLIFAQNMERGLTIHIGNGMTLASSALVYDSSAVLEILEEGAAALAGRRMRHLTPLLADLNIYPDDRSGRQDSIMLSRGIGMYLVRKGNEIHGRRIGGTVQDTLIAWQPDLEEGNPEGFWRYFTKLQDNIAAFNALQPFPDSNELPNPDILPLEILRKAAAGDIYWWIRSDESERVRTTVKFLNQFSYRMLIEAAPAELRELGLSNAVYLRELEAAGDYLSGDLQEVNSEHSLDYNEEVLVQMPVFSSFWESLRYFHARDERQYTDEQILQLYTVIPYALFTEFFTVGVIEVSGPPQYAIFSTEPFSTRSIVLDVVIDGKSVYVPR